MAEDTIKPPDLKNSPGSTSKGSFFSQHKGIVVGGIIILVGGGIFLLSRRKSSSSVTPNTATPQVVYPTSSGGGTGSNMTGYGAYNSLAASLAQGNQNLAGQLTSLQDTLHTLINAVHSANNPGGATNPTPPAQIATPGWFAGVGFGPPSQGSKWSTAYGSTGSAFQYLPSATAVHAAQSAGQSLYYQPGKGDFIPTGSDFTGWKTTPIFVKG